MYLNAAISLVPILKSRSWCALIDTRCAALSTELRGRDGLVTVVPGGDLGERALADAFVQVLAHEHVHELEGIAQLGAVLDEREVIGEEPVRVTEEAGTSGTGAVVEVDRLRRRGHR